MDNNQSIIPNDAEDIIAVDEHRENGADVENTASSNFKEALESVVDKIFSDKSNSIEEDSKELFGRELESNPDLCEEIDNGGDSIASDFLETMNDIFSIDSLSFVDVQGTSNEGTDNVINVIQEISKGVIEAIGEAFFNDVACEIADKVEAQIESAPIEPHIADAISSSLDAVLLPDVREADLIDSAPLDLGDEMMIDNDGAFDAVTGDPIPYDFANEDAVDAFVAATNDSMTAFLADIDYSTDNVDIPEQDIEATEIDAIDGGVDASEPVDYADVDNDPIDTEIKDDIFGARIEDDNLGDVDNTDVNVEDNKDFGFVEAANILMDDFDDIEASAID